MNGCGSMLRPSGFSLHLAIAMGIPEACQGRGCTLMNAGLHVGRYAHCFFPTNTTRRGAAPARRACAASR
eukprot:scaffold130953_cov32-Tisochrysis_lutea.AAC.3